MYTIQSISVRLYVPFYIWKLSTSHNFFCLTDLIFYNSPVWLMLWSSYTSDLLQFLRCNKHTSKTINLHMYIYVQWYSFRSYDIPLLYFIIIYHVICHYNLCLNWFICPQRAVAELLQCKEALRRFLLRHVFNCSSHIYLPCICDVQDLQKGTWALYIHIICKLARDLYKDHVLKLNVFRSCISLPSLVLGAPPCLHACRTRLLQEISFWKARLPHCKQIGQGMIWNIL